MTKYRSMWSILRRLSIPEKTTVSALHRLLSFGTCTCEVYLCYLLLAACAQVLDRVQNRIQQCDNLWLRGSCEMLCLDEPSFFFFFIFSQKTQKKKQNKKKEQSFPPHGSNSPLVCNELGYCCIESVGGCVNWPPPPQALGLSLSAVPEPH